MAAPPTRSARKGWISREAPKAAGVVIIVLLSTMITFAIGYFSPTSPAVTIAGETATPRQIALIEHSLGLNRGFFTRYGEWLWNALHGDLGTAYISKVPVMHTLGERLPVDASIIVLALLIAIVLGFAAGILAGVRPHGPVDRGVTALSSVAQAIPEFWLGILLVVVFAVRIKALPASGYTKPSEGVGEWLKHIILPSVTLALPVAAVVARQLRTSLVGAFRENYVVGAVVRGLRPSRILFKHVLRNASVPAVTTIGLAVPQLLAGAVLVEVVFALPGLGQLAVESAQSHDVPVIQGVLLVTIVVVLISNALTDLATRRLRPAGGRR